MVFKETCGGSSSIRFWKTLEQVMAPLPVNQPRFRWCENQTGDLLCRSNRDPLIQLFTSYLARQFSNMSQLFGTGRCNSIKSDDQV
jgi:hypothetical protein